MVASRLWRRIKITREVVNTLEWTIAFRETVEYIEQNLLSDLTLDTLAKHVHISQFYFHKAFNIMSGYTVAEYIRNRRLYLAALDLIENDDKVIDLAYRYGYETPESFTKAFSRFHGLSPTKLKKQPYMIKPFHPIEINISVKGGDQLEYTIEEMDAFKVIGIGARFSYENAFDKIPEFWREWKRKCSLKIDRGLVSDFNIGKYGICIDVLHNPKEFDYYIAGDYDENSEFKGCEIIEIPALTWVKFRCIGPMPVSLQALNTRIYKEWLPENKNYEITWGYNIEVYGKGEISDSNYKSEIWIPIKK